MTEEEVAARSYLEAKARREAQQAQQRQDRALKRAAWAAGQGEAAAD